MPGVSSYQLRPWTEQDSEKWVEKAARLPIESLGAPPRAVIAFRVEQLLRFPGSESWPETAWEVVRMEPENDHLPGTPPGQTAFTWMFESLLNQQKIALDDLSASAENYLIRIADSLVVKNLFGDRRDALVFNAEMNYYDHLCGTFGLRNVGDLYQVETVQAWEVCSFPGAGLYYSLESLGDTNGNGLPEIGVIGQAGMSGIPQTWAESLDWYEWNSAAKTFSAKSFSIFSQTLEVQRTYRWNGKEYTFVREQIVPAPADPAECRLAWADQAIRFQEESLRQPGWKNNEAINIIAKALENWSDSKNLWGPAGKDYFRLRLGIWRDLRGESDAAVNLLQSLAAQPSDPKYDFASQIAAIYLENRAQQGIFKACLAAENAWIDSIRSDLPEIYDFDDLIDKWGFVNRRWNSSMGLGASVESLCSFQDGLVTGVKTLQISTSLELQQWLEDAGVQTLGVESGDFNEDGQPDYLAMVVYPVTQWFVEQKIWAFVQTSNGMVATQLISSGSPEGEESPSASLAWKNYRLASIPFPVSIVWAGSDLIAFRVGSDGIAQRLFRDFNVNSYIQVGDGFSVLAMDRGQNKQIITYTWDKVAGRFTEQIAGYDFASVEHEVEQLLFIEQNFPAAIVRIEIFRVEAPPEPRRVETCYEHGCTYFPDWYHPYLRYLLGIAYEMTGKPELAVETYFRLWQDYPDQIFGQAAANKLTLQQP
jgi:hypothetical protein